ncbi:MAG: DUF1573 domain-containing protein [Prevotellaceae bacterium]|jgi:hypothetical protein|nr:DUF1573 domain-containing protein [Prevotellaceae bacterium]
MKKISILFAAVAMSVSVMAQEPVKQEVSKDAPVITFKETIHDFGKVEQGKPVTVEFEFTNTGNTPLVVSNAKPSCGCTVSNWTKTPVEPGKTGTVTATYNAANAGSFTKTVTVSSNATTPELRLTVRGEVTAKAAVPVKEQSEISGQ